MPTNDSDPVDSQWHHCQKVSDVGSLRDAGPDVVAEPVFLSYHDGLRAKAVFICLCEL